MNPGNISDRIGATFASYIQGTSTKPLVDTKNPLSIAMTHFNEPIYKAKEGEELSDSKKAANALNLVGNIALIGLSNICPPVFIGYGLSIAFRKGCEACAKKIDQNNLNDVEKAISTTQPINTKFTTSKTIEEQRTAHAEAKSFLRTNLEKLGAKVEFLKTPETPPVNPKNVEIKQNLDPEVFSWEKTNGVQKDIKKDGQRTEKNVIIYGVASQFNGSESMTPKTITPERVIAHYEMDSKKTQGADAQLAFSDEQVKVICCGSNKGYNALCNVLDEGTKNATEHGYITPHGGNGQQILDQLRQDVHKTEYLCVANKPKGGDKPVHQVMLSVPAFGGYETVKLNKEKLTALETAKKEEIQFIFALNAYRALFEKGIAEAKKGKEVIIKPPAIGLGAFGNEPEIVAKAYWYAAAENQSDLKKYGVQVRFQIFEKPSGELDVGADIMKNFIGLQEYKP